MRQPLDYLIVGLSMALVAAVVGLAIVVAWRIQ